jgi:hypothetical protein
MCIKAAQPSRPAYGQAIFCSNAVDEKFGRQTT